MVSPSCKITSSSHYEAFSDHISLPALVKNDIRLGNTPDISTNAVADLGVMLALMAARNVKYAMSVVQTGQVSSRFLCYNQHGFQSLLNSGPIVHGSRSGSAGRRSAQ